MYSTYNFRAFFHGSGSRFFLPIWIRNTDGNKDMAKYAYPCHVILFKMYRYLFPFPCTNQVPSLKRARSETKKNPFFTFLPHAQFPYLYCWGSGSLRIRFNDSYLTPYFTDNYHQNVKKVLIKHCYRKLAFCLKFF